MIHLYAGLLGLHTLLFSVSPFPPLLALAEDQRPRSALEWITVSEAKKLPNGFWNSNLVRDGLDGWNRRMFCRAMKDGCPYPGEAWYANGDNNNGIPYCRIITKEKVYPPIKNFQLLYNPNGAAKVAWLPWNEGTGNLNFPTEVVKSDESRSCNFMLARYNDRNENGFVDSEGYVYYQLGPGEGWNWDNNEYDLLIERSAKEIELIELNYGDPKRTTGEVQGQGSFSETNLVNEDFDNEKMLSTSLESTYTSSKSWSHSVEVKDNFMVLAL